MVRLVLEGHEAGGHARAGRQAQRELLHRTILDVLELRGLPVTQATQERIESCDELETLERWYAAVKSAAANQPVEQLLI